MTNTGGLLGGVIGALFTAVLIIIVGKLNLGIKVKNFWVAFITAVLIALLTLVVQWIWSLIGFTPPSEGFFSAITWALSSAAILMTAGSFVKGLTVDGFFGALIASVVIAGLNWIIIASAIIAGLSLLIGKVLSIFA